MKIVQKLLIAPKIGTLWFLVCHFALAFVHEIPESVCMAVVNNVAGLRVVAMAHDYTFVTLWSLFHFCCSRGNARQIQSITDESRSSIRRKNHSGAHGSGLNNQISQLDEEKQEEVENARPPSRIKHIQVQSQKTCVLSISFSIGSVAVTCVLLPSETSSHHACVRDFMHEHL